MSDAPPMTGVDKIEPGASISYGWEAVKKYPAPLIGAFFIVWLASALLNGVGQVFDNLFISLVMSIAATIVSIILTKGLVTITLDITQGRQPDLSKLLTPDHLVNYILAGIIVGLAVGVGLLLCLIPGLFAAVALQFTSYRVIDRGESAIDAVSGSWELVKPQFGSLVILMLALFGINIVGLLLCGIGLLVTAPLSAVAMAHAYRTASGQSAAAI